MTDGGHADWNWRFFGFLSLDGKCPVQEWFDNLSKEAKDDACDTFGYLEHLPLAAWTKPQFDRLRGEEVTEVRFKTKDAIYRIYGYYGPASKGRQVYTLLYGHDKKTSNDVKGKKEATRRKQQIEREEATVHEFKFYRKPNGEN